MGEVEIPIGRGNWWLLLPLVFVVGGILTYRYCDWRAEVARVEPFVERLAAEDPLTVAEALLEIRKAGLYAEPFLDRIVPLLGDERSLPPEIRSRPGFAAAMPTPRGFEGLASNARIGDLAAAALVAMASNSSGGLLYSESGKQAEIQRKVSRAVRPLLQGGTTLQRRNALRVLNMARVRENLPAIARLLEDEDPTSRAHAASMFIAYAPLFDVGPYLPKLRSLRDDEDETVRLVATKVLAVVEAR
jgi:hypothetical protein